MSVTTSNELLNAVKSLINQARSNLKRTVNNAMAQTYWQIGRLIVEDEQNGEKTAQYGQQLLQNLAKQLTIEFGRGFELSNLKNMRQFYLAYPNSQTLSGELTWSHYCRLIRIKNKAARQWYATEAVEQQWSVRALDRQVNKLYYERLLSTHEQLPVKNEAVEKTKVLKDDPKNYLRDPYILDFMNLPNYPSVESELEGALIQNLQAFLLELGKGFAFVERQQRIKTADQDFYIDLVFYNFKLNCFVLIDLKIGKLTHQDVGQMDTYVRIYDQHKKGERDNPTTGLLLCNEKSEAVAKYSVLADKKQLFASKYFDYLPSEKELEAELSREVKLLGNELGYDPS